MKILTSVLFTLCFAVANGQQKPSLINSKDILNIHYNQKNNTPDFIELSKESNILVSNLENWYKSTLNLSESFSLNKLKSITDRLNQEHTKYQIQYLGYPVEFEIINAHAKAGKLISLNGTMNSLIAPKNSISLNAENAWAKAKEIVGASSYKINRRAEEQYFKKALNNPNFSYDPKTHIVLFPILKPEGKEFRYAYKMDVFAHEPESREDIYIDAESGELLLRLNKIMDGNSKGTAITKYHGTRSIVTDSISPTRFELREYDRLGQGVEIETLNSQTNFENGAIPFLDSDNLWNNVNAFKDEAATDAHWALEQSFDYFYQKHNRLGYDNFGAKLLLYVHYDKNWFNAQWVGSYMRFGDGNGQPLTSIDIVGHELTHGVTQESANLIYQGESGALNESFSDIFGSAIEFSKDTAGSNWEIGKGNFKLRNMSNPNLFAQPDTYEGTSWINVKGCSPTGNNNFCGVHTNSGVQNFWYYLLVNGGNGSNDKGQVYSVQAIGLDKASEIAYRNLTVYLNSSSDYADAAFFGIKSAIDLFGEGSIEHIATVNAWHAVGLGKPYTTIPVADFSILLNQCTVNSTISFLNESGSATSQLWDFGDGTQSLQINPTHLYANSGAYDVKLIATNLNGSDTLTKIALINIFTQTAKPSNCSADAVTPFAKVGIYRVQFNSIDNSSLPAIDEGGYIDNQCLRTYVQPGLNYPITITTSPANSVFSRTFIDFNDNGDFDLPTELVFSTNATTQTHTGTISIPANAVLDKPIRMRVISGRSNGNTPDVPCSIHKGGQIEDYSIVVSNSVGIAQLSKTEFSIFPNPANQTFNLKVPIAKGFYSIVDLRGRILKSSIIQTESTLVDISNLAKGLYFVIIDANSKRAVSKLVVE